VRRGVRGGGVLGPPSGGAGGWSPPRRGSGAVPLKKNFAPGRHISGTTYYRDDIFLGPHDI
jgi:hypothetical protein